MTAYCSWSRNYAFGGGRSGESERERGTHSVRTAADDGAGTPVGNALVSTAVKAVAQGVMDWHDECGTPDCWHGD